MAIFRRYVRPGPGVSKDAVPKRRLVLFFEILARRFFDLIKLNLLFVVPIILDLILIYVLNVYATYFFAVGAYFSLCGRLNLCYQELCSRGTRVFVW